MNRALFITGCFVIAEIFFSCNKNIPEQNTGDAEWIKVISDSTVYFPGKIRSDAESNLFCSYNYTDYKVDSNSAIIKLNKEGTMLWRKEFNDLTIFDFVITEEGDAVIASCSGGMITLTFLSGNGANTSLLGSYLLPLSLDKIRDILGMKILINELGNYIICTTVFYRQGNTRLNIGFLVEADKSGNQLWMQDYFFPAGEFITITGCAAAADGYILFGNNQDREPIVSNFFILRCNTTGDSLWTKIYETSWFDSTGIDSGTYSGYYCSTSDIIPCDENNFYACAFNERYNLPNISGLPIYSEDDNSARIFKISSDGILIDSALVNYDFQNMAADLVRTRENGVLVGFNPIQLVGTYYLGKQTSYVAHLSSDLTLQSVSNIQKHYYDYLGSICATPDGHYAIETMIQSLGGEKYLLEIIKTDVNGNF